MKITKLSIYKLLIVLILLANATFFSLPRLSSAFFPICSYHDKLLVVVLILFLFAYEFISGMPRNIFKGSTTLVVNYYILMCASLVVYSLLCYNSVGLRSLIKNYYYLAAILLFYCLKCLIYRYPNFYDWLIRALVIMALLYAVYMILCKLAYEFAGLTLFDETVQYIQSRGGSLRLARSADVICLGCVYSLCLYFRKDGLRLRQRRKYLIFFVIETFAVLFVSQTRVYELAVLVIFMLLLLHFKKGNRKMILIMSLSLALPVFISIGIDFVESFFTKENLWGTTIRISGYGYYFKHMFDGVLWGIGFVEGSDAAVVLRGSSLRYTITDMGIMGFLGVYGLVGLVFLAMLLFLFFNTYRKLKRKALLEANPEAIAIPIFFLIISVTLAFSDSQRCLLLPLLLASYVKMEKDSKSFT